MLIASSIRLAESKLQHKNGEMRMMSRGREDRADISNPFGLLSFFRIVSLSQINPNTERWRETFFFEM